MVVAIIGLLVAILVPALGGARTQAKIVATQSLQSSISVSLDQFKQESRLNGNYPPSATDEQPGAAAIPQKIGNPFKIEPAQDIGHTTGASLLVYALRGADGLGTPGFTDLNNQNGWWDDFGHKPASGAPHGAHELDLTTADPKAIRYGPYATTDPMVKSVKSIRQLIENGKLFFTPPSPGWHPTLDGADYNHLTFTDSFDRPILYYRARRAARAIVPVPGGTPVPGVYNPADNAYLTGDEGLGGGIGVEGVWFKAGVVGKHRLSKVYRTLLPTQDTTVFGPVGGPGYDPMTKDTFEEFIYDSKVTGRITPVNKDTYLLISAGPDAIYGTADDVTNFAKN